MSAAGAAVKAQMRAAAGQGRAAPKNSHRASGASAADAVSRARHSRSSSCSPGSAAGNILIGSFEHVFNMSICLTVQLTRSGVLEVEVSVPRRR